jgi:ABC-type phosphate/phosphonate transport system substrate-binding protein
MQCSFPMYDMPEVQKYNDIIFKYLGKEIMNMLNNKKLFQKYSSTVTNNGINLLKDTFGIGLIKLHRPSDQSTAETENVWESKALLISHICGQPLTTEVQHTRQLQAFGAPVYKVDGCTENGYTSFIIVRSTDAHLYKNDDNDNYSIHNLSGKKLCVNHLNSYSGCISLKNKIFNEINKINEIDINDDKDIRIFFNPDVIITGSHRESIRYVKNKIQNVDIAAIDCITYQLILKYAPEELNGVTCIGKTVEGPSPPFVTKYEYIEREGLYSILCDAFENTLSCNLSDASQTAADRYELRNALDALFIKKFQIINPKHYEEKFLELNMIAKHIKFDLWKEHDNGKRNDTFMDYYSKLDLCYFSFLINTSNDMCQTWFNRGMLLAYNFNHEAARECFFKCLKEDHECVMACWGICYVSGVYYNNQSCTQEQMDIACKYVKLGLSIIKTRRENKIYIPTLEELLLEAVQCRALENYSEAGDDSSEIGKKLLTESNIKYSKAMYHVYSQFPLHPDVTSLYAESLMNLTPWKLWPPTSRDRMESNTKKVSQNIGTDKNTVEIITILENGIKNNRKPHPGLAHLYVHAVEQSPFINMVQGATHQSNLLRSQWPAAGHLLHMASHIDMQIGKYEAAIQANRLGILQDHAFATEFGSDNYYHGYKIHNHHMLVWGAMFAGKYHVALSCAEIIFKETSKETLHRYIDYMEPYLSDVWHVLIRFGRWDDIILKPLPEKTYFVWTCWAWYAKALAHSALGNINEALNCKTEFLNAKARVPSSRYLHNVTSAQMFQIAEKMIDGEIEYRRGNYEIAFECLSNAIELEDNLDYDEPWGWMIPTRHAYGALKLERGLNQDIEDAYNVYSKDLDMYPNNIWSLIGVKNCLIQLINHHTKPDGIAYKNELENVRFKLKLAMNSCDVEIKYSCFCAGLKSSCCET